MPNIAAILKLLEKGIEVQEAISKEISKEKNARRRRKLKRLCEKKDLAAIRSHLFDV